jgi:hypothetical protein
MKTQWTIAALLSSALIVGCSDRGTENARNYDENAAPAPAEPGQTATSEAPVDSYTRGDDSAVRENRVETNARATTGTRRAPASSSATAPSNRRSEPPAETRSNAAPEPERRFTENRAPARNVEAPAAPLPEWRELRIPAGTSLPLELTTALSSETAQVEAPVSARLRQAVTIDGYTALPAGSVVTGTVTDVERAGRVKGRAHLAFKFNQVQVRGEREDLETNPVSFEGEASKGEDATKIGAGAGIGAVIGGIVGGGKGAAKGGAIGAAAGTGAVLATRGKEVEVASGTDITATLAQPATVRVQIR